MDPLKEKVQLGLVCKLGPGSSSQYKELCEYLVKLIKGTKTLDSKIYTPSTDEAFTSSIANIRDNLENKNIALLFVSPETDSTQAQEDIQEAAEQIVGYEGDREAKLASFLVINKDTTTSELKFKDHKELIKPLAAEDYEGDLKKDVAEIWSQLSHLGTDSKLKKLKKNVANYFQDLMEFIAPKEKKKIEKHKTKQELSKKNKKSFEHMSFKELGKKDQKAFLEHAEIIRNTPEAPSKHQTQRDTYFYLLEGKTYAEISTLVKIKPVKVKESIQNFLEHPQGFIKNLTKKKLENRTIIDLKPEQQTKIKEHDWNNALEQVQKKLDDSSKPAEVKLLKSRLKNFKIMQLLTLGKSFEDIKDELDVKIKSIPSIIELLQNSDAYFLKGTDLLNSKS